VIHFRYQNEGGGVGGCPTTYHRSILLSILLYGYLMIRVILTYIRQC